MYQKIEAKYCEHNKLGGINPSGTTLGRTETKPTKDTKNESLQTNNVHYCVFYT